MDSAVEQALRGEVELLSSRLGDAYEELSLVYAIGDRITVDRPVEPFLRDACEEAADVMTARGAGVLVWDDRLGQIEPVYYGEPALDKADLTRIDTFLRRRLLVDGAETAGEMPFVRDNELEKTAEMAWLTPRGQQLLAVPMRRQGTIVGCLFAIDKDVPAEIFGIYNDGVFTSIDRKLLGGVAVHVALFLENRRLFRDTEALMMGLLHSMVAAVDAKDAYTCGHSMRVALFAKRLAEEVGRDSAFCERVYLSGLLHDVGKIGVEDAVLRKPGKLTDEEFRKIKRHPEIGHRILQGVPNIADVLPGVLSHHEKYDGRGYPHGLVGEDIPELGRLMCIADSFDAMTSSRTYRSAMPLERALDEVRRCAGTQFDPEFAEAFCQIPREDFEALIRRERDRDLPRFVSLMSRPRQAA